MIDHHVGLGGIFKKNEDATAYIISDINVNFTLGIINNELYKVLSDGYLSIYAEYFHIKKLEINNPIIMTAKSEKDVSGYILSKITHRVRISEDYLDSQVVDIIRRRLEYCNIAYDKVIPAGLARVYKNDLRKIIDVLKSCITVMRARGDNKLEEKHIKRVLSYI